MEKKKKDQEKKEQPKKEQPKKDQIKKEEQKKDKKAKKKKNKQNVFSKIGNVLKNKWLIRGTTTLALIIIIVAIYIGITMLVEKYTLPQLDLTESKRFTLSDQSVELAKGIDKEVKITIANYGNDSAIESFTRQLNNVNDKIQLEKIDDLSSRADLMQKYNLQATSKFILIASDGKERTVTDDELYSVDYNTYQTVDTTEESLINSIINVTTKDEPKVYFLGTHTRYEYTAFTSLTQYIQKESNVVSSIDILTKGDIPEDCDCLVITTLKEDITEQERDKIIEYINRGGEILFMCGPNLTDATLNNFQQVLDQYGVKIGDGVIFEGDTSNMLYGYPDLVVESDLSTEVTKKISSTLSLCLVDAANITFDEDKLSDLQVEKTEMVKTTNKAFIRTQLSQQSVSRTSLDGEEGEYTVAALATKKVGDDKESKMIIFGNELFGSDQQIPVGQYTVSAVNLYNNKDMILNSIAYLNEREDLITVRKNTDSVSYTPTEQQNKIIMAVIFLAPIVIIVGGVVVWQIRRRKK